MTQTGPRFRRQRRSGLDVSSLAASLPTVDDGGTLASGRPLLQGGVSGMQPSSIGASNPVAYGSPTVLHPSAPIGGATAQAGGASSVGLVNGVLDGVSDGGKLTKRVPSHKLYPGQLDDTCCGSVGNGWGICLASSSGGSGCGIASHSRKKVTLPPCEEGDMMYVIPAVSKRTLGNIGVARGIVLASALSEDGREIWESDDLTTEQWGAEFENPQNYRATHADDEEEEEEEEVKPIVDGQWIGWQVQQVQPAWLSDQLAFQKLEFDHYNFDEPAEGTEELHNVVDESRTNLVLMQANFEVLAAKLFELDMYCAKMETTVVSNGSCAQNIIGQMRQKLYAAEVDIGDIESFSVHIESLVGGLEMVLGEVRTNYADTAANFESVDDDLDEMEKAIKASCQSVYERVVVLLENSKSAPSSGGMPSPGITADQSFMVDGQPTTVAEMSRDVSQLKKDVQSTQDSIGASGGVSFKHWSYPNTGILDKFICDQGNAEGLGIGSFVEAFNMWVHAPGNEIKAKDVTSTTKKLTALSYQDSEIRLISSVGHTSIAPYYKSVDVSPKMGFPVPVLSKWEAWFGQDGLDGHSQDIIHLSRECKAEHESYVNDNLPQKSLELRSMATSMMTECTEFINNWHSVIHQECMTLDQIGLPRAAILQLLSDQTHWLINQMRQIRSEAYAASQNVTFRSRLTRHLWVTMKVHAFMSEISELKFKHHPSMSNAFVRFLTTNLATLTSPSDKKLRLAVTKLLEEKLKSFQDEITKLRAEVKAMSGVAQRASDDVNKILKFHPELLRPKK